MLLQFVFKSKAKIPTQTKNPTNVCLNGVISLLLVLIQSIHLLPHSQDELPTYTPLSLPHSWLNADNNPIAGILAGKDPLRCKNCY